jgi:type IV secretory pathway VirJ component
VFGADEQDSVCARAAEAGLVKRAELGGGHHFGGDYRDAANLILAADPTRASNVAGVTGASEMKGTR